MSEITYGERQRFGTDVITYSVFNDGVHIGFIKRQMGSWQRKRKGVSHSFGTTYGVVFRAFTPSGEQVGYQWDRRGDAAEALLREVQP